MTDVVCRIRLGSAFSSAVPSVWRDEASTFTAEFRDRTTDALVDVSGVTARLWYPSGAEVSPAPTPTESEAGIWTVAPTPDYEGVWTLSFTATSPEAATASYYFRVKATEPDEGPPPEPSYIEAVSLMERAETAADAAEAAAAEAENAVSAGLGPVVTSSVSGTTTAYTATASADNASGRSYWFRPNATNEGSATLAINGGTARSLRTETGTVLTAGMLRSDTEYLIRFDGTVFRVLGMRLAQRFQSRVNLVGTTATLDGQATGAEGTIVSRITGMAGGDVILQVNNGAGGLQTALLAYGSVSAASASKTTGTVLISGDLQVAGDIVSTATFTGAPVFEGGVNMDHRLNLRGATATVDGYTTAGGDVVTRFAMNAGNIVASTTDNAGGLDIGFILYGAGNSSGRPAQEFRTFGGARVEGNLHVVGSITSSTSATATEENPSGSDSLIQLMEEFGGTGAYESLSVARSVANIYPFQITPSDHGRQVRTNVNGSFIDAGDMANNTEAVIHVLTGGTVSLWTGTPGVSWTGRTSERVSVSTGRYRVYSSTTTEREIEAINGKTITDVDVGVTPIPTYNRRIAVLGYSNSIRAMKNISGWRDQFLAWGEDPSCVNVISGVGASCFLEGGESGFVDGNSGTYNHWWKWRTSAPGPNMQVLLDAVAAAPSSPTMEYVLVHLGYPDMNLWAAADNPLSAALTEAQMVGHWADALTWLKGASGLNISGLKFVICPMAHRHVAVWDRKYWYAMRRMMLQLCADHPTLCVRGPDSFDVRYIPDDSHPTIRSQGIFSGRWARWTETIAERKSMFLGPEVSSVVQDSDTSTRIIIDPGLNDTYADDAGEALRFPGQSGDWTSAPLPPGIALLPPGSDYITDDPIEITNVRWSYNGTSKLYTLTLTHEAQANVRFCWPYGFMNEVGEDPSLCIRSLTSGEPLATYHPDVPLPKNLP